jgi:aldose 1-epimerase
MSKLSSEIEIKFGDYQALVRRGNGALSALTFEDRPLIEKFERPDLYSGDILAPWPNRIRDGRYEFEGKIYQLEINERNRNNALHGLVSKLDWTIISQTVSQVCLGVVLSDLNYYPTQLELKVDFQLSASGLKWTITAENIGTRSAPYGVSIHPYLVADSNLLINECYLRLAANNVLDVDRERLLPTQLRDVTELDFDFRSSKLIDNRLIDHAFEVDIDCEPVLEFRGPSGHGVQMKFDKNAKWIQIHTADRDGSPYGRRALAVEPMSCPPDAFNTGLDLIILKPNDEHSMIWEISAI